MNNKEIFETKKTIINNISDEFSTREYNISIVYAKCRVLPIKKRVITFYTSMYIKGCDEICYFSILDLFNNLSQEFEKEIKPDFEILGDMDNINFIIDIPI